MRHCDKFLHTGSLESFHSTKLKYLPKSSAFKMDTQIVMTMLTALEHNYGLTASTETRKKAAYSRAQKKFVLKNENIRDTESVRKNIVASMIENIRNNHYRTLDLSSLIRKPIPQSRQAHERRTCC